MCQAAASGEPKAICGLGYSCGNVRKTALRNAGVNIMESGARAAELPARGAGGKRAARNFGSGERTRPEISAVLPSVPGLLTFLRPGCRKF